MNMSYVVVLVVTTGLAISLSFGQGGNSPGVDRASQSRGEPPLVSTTGPQDASSGSVSPVVSRTTVEVFSNEQSGERYAPSPYHVTASEILSSAGTYGDFSRYVQQLPGVVFTSDQSDDILVRGGHPMENLFLVDGFEVPNLNHLSAEGTTGGFASMIDTNAIENLDLHTGGYDARYSERLSSVIEIHTREPRGASKHVEGDVGITGAGALVQIGLNNQGSFLLSAHRSLLNLFTKDIGMNGVPIYSNLFGSLHLNPTAADRFTAMSLNGIDSIDVRPCPGDAEETNTIDTSYSGWRSTNGVSWQHIHSPRLFSVLSAIDSEQHEAIDQTDQIFGVSPGKVPMDCSKGVPLTGTPVYGEHTLDGASTLRYDLTLQAHARASVIAGSLVRLVHPRYRIEQPVGEQSPYTQDAARTDADSFDEEFLSKESGSYLEATFHPLSPWSISLGGRAQTFSFGDHVTVTPRANTSYRLSSHATVHAAFGRYAQMPPYVDLVSYQSNRRLGPIFATHYVVGADLWQSGSDRVSIEMYRKQYRDYPVSSEYPSLSMANTADTLGQEFLWLPFVSQGHGRSDGIELLLQGHLQSRFHAQGTIAYARARFSGLDGVLRPSNFDYPVVANATGIYRAGRGFEGAFRYGYSTGRPYTPFLLGAALAQNRPIYDLGQVNAVRAPFYSRLDFQINKVLSLEGRTLIVYAGMENALNRQNFLAYAWEPRRGYDGKGGSPIPVGELHQMPHFPNIGVRFIF